MKVQLALAAAAAACIAGGCIQVKTESEIKPIHITMDVNLKVDKDLDKAFADENNEKPKGNFKAVKAMVDRQAAGITNRAMLEERNGATDDDRLLIAEENARRMKRFGEVAKSNGTTIEVAQKRYAAKLREKLSAGAWFQDDSGKWSQKKWSAAKARLSGELRWTQTEPHQNLPRKLPRGAAEGGASAPARSRSTNYHLSG